MPSKKGPKYERRFCKDLSLWWTNGKRDDIFWRTASSGARATVRLKKGKRTADSYGDVKAEHELGKPLTKTTVFSLKRGYTGKKGKQSLRWASLLDIIDGLGTAKAIPAITKWWEELMTVQIDSRRKRGFLVFKRDRKRGLLGMAPSVFNEIEKANGEYRGQYILVKAKPAILILLPVDDFFAWCKPETLGRDMRQIKRRK
jgi:hypothetical protein